MKRCSLLVIPLMFLILSACVFNPSTTPLVVETSPTATPSAPAAVDLGIIGQGMAKTAAWSTDGKIMAVASSHGIYLYDTATWQTFKFIPIKDSEYRNGLAQIWFPPDGKSMWYAYVTTPKLSIYQYDLASDKTTPLYQELVFSEFTKFVFSPNGRTFANIGVIVLDEKGEPELQPQIEIREISSGKLLQTLKSDRKWWGSFNIGLASFSPHGHLFATGDSDNTVRVWSTETGLLLFEQNHDANVESVAFSPDSKMLVSTGDDATVRFWDARTGENIYTLREFNHGLVYLSYSMSGSELLLGMSVGSYQRWAVNEHFLPVAHKEMDFEPDRYEYSEYLGLQFINSNGDHLAVIQDANIQVFDLARENQSITLSEFNSSLSGVEFGPDGNLLALIDRNIHLWDMNSRKVLGTLQINQYEVTDAAFSPDGKQIAVAGNDIQIWDVGTLHKIREIDTGGGQIAYSPDGSLLATGGWYEVTIWSPDTGESIRSFQAELGKPLALSFGLNGKSLIFVAQNGVRVWDTASGKILLPKDEKKKQPDIDNVLVYSSDSFVTENFISCMDGGELNFWSLETSQPLYTLHAPFCGQGYSTVHPSKRLIAYVSAVNESSQIYLSDMASGENILVITVPQRIGTLRFSPDGTILAAVEAWDVVHLRDISTVSKEAEELPITTATPVPTDTPTPSPTPAIADEIPLPWVTPQSPASDAITVSNVDKLESIGALGGSKYNANPYTIAWPRDGQEFAIGTLGAVYVYRTGSDSLWRSFKSGKLVEELDFSPDGRFLAEQNNSNKIIVWDLIEEKHIHTFIKNCWTAYVKFSADNTILTIDCPSNTSREFDLESGKLLSQKEGSGYDTMNKDGSLAVFNNSYYVYLEDAHTGNILRVFESRGSFSTAAFSPDGKILLVWHYGVPVKEIVQGEEQTVWQSVAELWNVQAGKETVLQKQIVTGETNEYGEMLPSFPEKSFAFTSNSKYLITTIWDGFVRIWDTGTGDLVSELPGGYRIFLSPDDKRLLITESFGRIQIWDLSTIEKPELFQTITDFEKQYLSCPIFFVKNGAEIIARSGNSIQTWKITQPFRNIKSMSSPLEEGTKMFTASQNGKYWATVTSDNNILLRDPENGETVQTPVTGSLSQSSSVEKIENLMFSNSGENLAASSYWHVWLWNLNSGLKSLDIQPEFPIGEMTFSPDGRLLAISQNGDGKAEIWDTQTGKRLRHFDNAGQQIAFSPDGLTLATGWRDGTIWFLDIRSGQMMRTIQAGEYLSDLTISPDGGLLVAKTSDGIEFWDANQGRKVKNLDNYAFCMAFSPDGTLFATMFDDNGIQLWDVTGK